MPTSIDKNSPRGWVAQERLDKALFDAVASNKPNEAKIKKLLEEGAGVSTSFKDPQGAYMDVIEAAFGRGYYNLVVSLCERQGLKLQPKHRTLADTAKYNLAAFQVYSARAAASGMAVRESRPPSQRSWRWSSLIPQAKPTVS